MTEDPRPRRPAEVFPPGEHLREEIEYRGWSVSYLARESGLDPSMIRGVLDAQQPVTPEIAEGLAKALGGSVAIWINMQRAWDSWRA